MPRRPDLFGEGLSMGTEGSSRVEQLAGLAPFTPVDRLNPYPRPWYYMWDAPVWRIMSSNRTIICSTQNEAVAIAIVTAANEGRLNP